MAETKESSSGCWKLVNDLVQLIGLVAVLTGLWRATARVDKVEQRQDAADEQRGELQDRLDRLQRTIKERADAIEQQDDAKSSDAASL